MRCFWYFVIGKDIEYLLWDTALIVVVIAALQQSRNKNDVFLRSDYAGMEGSSPFPCRFWKGDYHGQLIRNGCTP